MVRTYRRLLRERNAAIKVAKDAVTKVQYCVDYMDGLGVLEEHRFTFPDGETWLGFGDTLEKRRQGLG